MDHWKPNNDFSSQPVIAATASPHDIVAPPPSNLLHGSIPEQPRQRSESEIKDTIAARKVQKADREKLRRDRLNEQFLELGSTLDPDRPKNDKATILTDAIQVLKDLTAEVRRLKAEYATLTEESRELTQEKNELREEKTSLKSDIESLNAQYQQRLRVAYPWASVDPAVVMGPPFSYPVPVPVPSGPIPMHPSLQPFPFFGSQNGGAISGPCSTFIPYPTPVNPPNEQPLAQQASASHVSSKQDSKSKSHHQTGNNRERCDDSDDVATDLELKTPGSSSKQESPNEARKGKQVHRKENKFSNVSSSSSYSSPQGNQESSSNSVTDIPKSNS